MFWIELAAKLKLKSCAKSQGGQTQLRPQLLGQLQDDEQLRKPGEGSFGLIES